jgi:hypothetical protein
MILSSLMAEHVYKMVDGFKVVAEWMERGIRTVVPELVPHDTTQGRKSCSIGIQLSRLDIEQRYMIVESDLAMDDVYVAIMGTKSLQDAYVDGRIQKRRVSRSLPGYAHAGFLSRSFKVPIRELYDMVVKRKGKRLVLCGHSLGGALAALCVVRLLDSLKSDDVDLSRIRCVTFGCPGVCDTSLASYVDRQGWGDVIQNVVVEDDPVVVLSAYMLVGKTVVLGGRNISVLNPGNHTMAYYNRKLLSKTKNNHFHDYDESFEVVVEQRVIVPRVMLSMVTGFWVGSEYILDLQGENLEWVQSVLVLGNETPLNNKSTSCSLSTDFATYRYPIRPWRPTLWVVGDNIDANNASNNNAVSCMTYEDCRSRLKRHEKKTMSDVSILFLLGKDDVRNTDTLHNVYTLCSSPGKVVQHYHIYAYDVHLSRDEVLKLVILTGASCIHDASVDSINTVLKHMAHEALRAKRAQMMGMNKSSSCHHVSLSSKL